MKKRDLGRPLRCERGEIFDLIVRTAMQMFLQEGFGDTTVEAIAGRARMSKATIYAHFPSKVAILEAGIESMARSLFSMPLLPDEQAPFFDRLLQIAEPMLDFALRPETVALERLTMAESYGHPQLAQIIHERGTMKGIRFLNAFFDDAVARGELHPVDTGLLAEHVHGVLVIFIRSAAHGTGSVTIDDAARERLANILKLIVDGIAI